MSESRGKMTPGPWSVYHNGTYGPWVHGPSGDPHYGTAHHDIGIERYEICTPHGPNAEANARAIAALPELVQAAQRLLSSLEDDHEFRCCDATSSHVPLCPANPLRRILARIAGGDA